MTVDPRAFELPARITREFLVHHRICPILDGRSGEIRLLCTPDAHIDVALTNLAEFFGENVATTVSDWEQVELSIERAVSGRVELVATASEQKESSSIADVRDLATQPPVIRYVNLAIREAFDAGASDLHLEMTNVGMTVRMRVDGTMLPLNAPSAGLEVAIMSRVKLMADLDIAERRRPQDGRIRVRLEQRELDVRVSTVPAADGESIVLRLLNQSGESIALSSLGMPAHVIESFRGAATSRQGLVLVTGPTGSGKSTTLYAGLQLRNAAAEKIIALEDPVEHRMKDVVQIPIDRSAGLTFPLVLRSVLRQDPDVILIGEMRDAETAHIAVQAALTGHLVLSTLHTNDAPSAIARLRDLGLPSYLIAASLTLIVAQRLVRKVCRNCSILGDPRQAFLPTGAVGHSKGSQCADCRGTGYSGRVGLFECTIVNDELRSWIAEEVEVQELKRRIGHADRSLRVDGVAKVGLGLTTLSEVLSAIPT